MTAVLSGPLNKGDVLTSTPSRLTLTMVCAPLAQSTSDIEVTLALSNNDVVSLFFSKICDGTEEAKDFFNIIYTIYWILLMLILALFGAVLYYYIKKNHLSMQDMYYKSTSYIRGFFDKVIITLSYLRKTIIK